MKGIYFNGNYIVKPGAYATIDGDGMMTLTAADQKIIALIGESAGGTPNEILWFDDPNVAKRVLKGGDLLKACEKAWAPVRKDGKIGEGAHIIGVIRANKATKSYLEMGDGVSVLSLISAPVARAENAGDGIFSVVGSYSGDTDKTVEVYIDSQGTQQLQDTTFCWRYAGETAWRAKKVPAQDNGNPVALVDEIKLLFADGSYVYNDIYTFDLQAEKTQRIAAVIESKDYGFLTKHTQVKYSPGSIDATMKLTVYNSDDEKYEVFDNIGAALFITYKGIQKYAGVEVKQNKSNTGKGIAEKFTILLGETEADAVEYIAVNLADDRFKRIKALADYISSFDDFQCTLSDSVAANITTADLDDMKIDISEGAGVLLAYWADIDKRVNAQSQYINITKQDPKADAPSFFDFTALSGGDDGITPASWIKFFDMFGPHPITYLVPLTGDESIHAEAREHVTHMSNALGRERFLMVGGWTGEPYTKAIERATGHNCERVQVLTPGFYDNDKNGLTLYPAYLTAAMHAGRAAFLPDGDSATFTTDIIDIEVIDKTTGNMLRVYRGCSISDFTETFRVGAIAGENATFQYLECSDNTDEQGGQAAPA